MVKFKVLQTNQVFMTSLGIHSKHLTEPSNEFFKSIISYLILAALIYSLILSIAQIYVSWSDVTSRLSAMLMAFCACQAIGMFLSIGLNMKKVKELHLQLQAIVDDGLFTFQITR